ncbi:hypothetical protein V6R21_15750 [Limibacter armeniacum]|uniref:hypothetical protein n=1 Tax=Limibacter armeniacum TaxID=466084 RepID=UPI002FE51D52
MDKLIFEVEISLASGVTIMVKNKELTLYYTKVSPAGKNTHAYSPLNEEWMYFFNSLTNLRWKDTYEGASSDAGDTKWKVRIVFREHVLVSSGVNDFPEDFNGFLESLLSLMGLNEL